MKHLIMGAGATVSEALGLGNAIESCPPLIRDFARKTWSNYTPYPLLESYLRSLGYEDIGRDPRDLFYRLEETGITNIEHFMQYVSENRNIKVEVSGVPPPGYISGLRISMAEGSTVAIGPAEGGGFWEDLLYHGIGSPLQLLMIQCFFENGKGWKDLPLSKSVAAHFDANDLILNLNYDTVFEIALTQLGRAFVYSPNQPSHDDLLVCKPHESLNMVVSETSFKFGQPEWLGMPQTDGFRSYSGLIPPRLNKQYAQHPIARMILAPVYDREPKAIVMWGVGLTESDEDLIDLYSRWLQYADVLDIINPNAAVADKAQTLFNRDVRRFSDVSEWLGRTGH